MDGEKKSRIISSLLWKFCERIGVQGIQFIIQICLARLLTPDDYGMLALVLVFINIAAVFVQGGFGSALIQKNRVDEEDMTSAFFICFAMACLFYSVLFVFAPYIASFYHQECLSLYLRTAGVILFPGAYNAIQNAFIQRNMLFQKLFKVSLNTIFISGAIGIILAAFGLGTWALIFQQITYNVVICIFLMKIVPWKPHLHYSKEKARGLFRFGSKLLLASLLNSIYRNLRNLVVGRNFSAETLGYLNRAEQLPGLIVNNVDGAMQSVLFPVYSSEQENKDVLKTIMRKSIKMSSFVLFPMMIGLMAVSKECILILFGETWLPCVPLMRIICLEFVFYPIHTANLQAINSVGRSDIYLRLEVLKKIFGLTILFASIQYGIYGIVTGSVLISIGSAFMNAYPNQAILNYSYVQQIKDIFPGFCMAAIMGVTVRMVSCIEMNLFFMFIVKIITGIAVYIGLAFIFRAEEMKFFKQLLSMVYNRHKK
ncbi:lipopolysaccharide biosynthesis protein [Clostridiaceae bacterium]|jgi:teichuronic acid exporter|nr:lipopolysaccharide biosynthesis protein [Clostridiaceae bacterium]